MMEKSMKNSTIKLTDEAIKSGQELTSAFGYVVKTPPKHVEECLSLTCGCLPATDKCRYMCKKCRRCFYYISHGEPLRHFTETGECYGPYKTSCDKIVSTHD